MCDRAARFHSHDSYWASIVTVTVQAGPGSEQATHDDGTSQRRWPAGSALNQMLMGNPQQVRVTGWKLGRLHPLGKKQSKTKNT